MPRITGSAHELADAPAGEASGDRPMPWRRVAPVGEGVTSTVWDVRHVETGRRGALKLAKAEGAAILAREAGVLARVSRRWGPGLLDAGPGFVVVEWSDGAPLDVTAIAGDRETLATIVAHAVGRALEELHQAGVHHGDVKPGNVLGLSPHRPTRDAADDRGATLIDLGLATRGADALGGTPRYASPELRARGDGGLASDLWALGILLAEILDPAVAEAGDPRATVAAWGGAREGAGRSSRGDTPEQWVEALLAHAPGGRPSAGWIARRAAQRLGLKDDPRDAAQARVARVRSAYLAERARDLVAGAVVSPSIGVPARAWLEESLAVAARLAQPAPRPGIIEPLSAVRRSRWLVSLVGPSAAAWPMSGPLDEPAADEGELVSRAVELAELREPAGWTLGDVRGGLETPGLDWCADPPGVERLTHLVRELARAAPRAEALTLAEDEVAAGRGTATLAVQLAAVLARAGETGRAWTALAGITQAEGCALRAEIARRRGDVGAARTLAEQVVASAEGRSPGSASASPSAAGWSAQATLARLAWDAGDLALAERHLAGGGGSAVAEVNALVAWRRGDAAAAAVAVARLDDVLATSVEDEAQSRLEGVKGLLQLAGADHAGALRSFGRAVERATRAGALVDEATYLTSEASAAADAGELGRAIASATRAALLWERLGRSERAAHAWLARAGAMATLGLQHATDEAADEARHRGAEARDPRVVAYARWAQVEVRAPGDPQARAWAIEADELLVQGPGQGEGQGDRQASDDALRARARRLVWATDTVDARELAAGDLEAGSASNAARLEWWGARARAIQGGRRSERDGAVLPALAALVDQPAPVWSRGPALEGAVRLATELGNGDAARRFELARTAAARALREGTPLELRASLASVAWAREAAASSDATDVAFAPAQVAQLEAIIRALSGRDRLRPLLEQVLDTMVLWAGVERGLLLLRAPDGRLVPRAARNLARHDLVGEQLALSQTIARRAIETGDAVVATDAFATLGDAHASVHALRLRSVLAVPLLARGEALGVVYLDDRVRKGAFGPRELAWVRVVASQAAMAIADARDAVLLRRAARRAERARARLETVLGEREAELDVTRSQLEMVQDGREHRYKYDAIAGRSEPMRDLLRLVDRVTGSDVPVLVIGESGTGKELVARAIHANGARSRKAFVTENCASVPESLLESALFGHVRGAFTGASATRAGLFDVADGGTLFLDEIGEMPLAMQAKLLRVLQDGEVRPVGGERARKVDVRVIGATHRDLDAMVAAGSFREDLYYRLNVVTLRVPALRERVEDIPILCDHFVRKHAVGDPAKITRAAMAKLATYPWPGNVRQLENEIRRALVMTDGAIDVGDLSADVVRGGPSAQNGASGLHLRARVDALEATLVQEALTKTRGNQTRAAQILGLSRFGLQKMVKRLGIKVPV